MARPTHSVNFRLTALQHKVMDLKGQNGNVKCIVIPLEANSLKLTEKENIFVNASGWFIDPDKRKNEHTTHSLTLDFGKDENVRRQQAGEKLVNCGSMIDWSNSGGGGTSNNANNTANIGPSYTKEDDLPF